jgi:hypothetical protein
MSPHSHFPYIHRNSSSKIRAKFHAVTEVAWILFSFRDNTGGIYCGRALTSLQHRRLQFFCILEAHYGRNEVCYNNVAMFLGRFRFLFGAGGQMADNLDRPLSNYDVLGIPTGTWSTGLCGCFENIIPSCVMSFCCPCFMWAQIVVRAQIPLLVSIKNAFDFLRRNTGYGAFVEYFFWSLVISIALLIIIIALHGEMPSIVTTLLAIVLVVVAGTLFGMLVHTRIAFREK